MKLQFHIRFCSFAVFLLAALRGLAEPQDASPAISEKGIVVESLTKDGQGKKAGMQEGDLLLSWHGVAASGEIASPFDLPFLIFAEAPRGPVRIDGLRENKKRSWLLGQIPWGIAARPNVKASILPIYLQAQVLAHSGKLAEAVKTWQAAATMAQESGNSWLSSWFLSHAGEALFLAKQMETSDHLYREAIQLATNSGPIVRGELFRQWSAQLEAREDFVNAEKYRRLELIEWKQLGVELLIANGLNGLGTLLLTKGDFSSAQSYLVESLGITSKLAPHSIQTALGYVNLAVVYQDKGELGQAQKYYQLALHLERKIFPGTYYLAKTLTNLGVLARWQGDLPTAQKYHREALAIMSRLTLPLEVANILANISDCRRDAGDLVEAKDYENQALAMREQSGAGLAVATSLGDLGTIAVLERNLDTAEAYFYRAMEIAGTVDPPPPQRAMYLAGLGDVLRARGNFIEAEQKYRQALAILEKSTPRSLDHSETSVSLGMALRQQGRLTDAGELYQQALSDLEYQAGGFGGNSTQARYRAKYLDYYREFVDLLIEEGQRERAFETLESSRARTLFEMLRLAQINIREGADAALLARERELRQSLNAKSQYRIRLLNERHTDEEMDGLDREIASMRESYQQVEADIRVNSPKYATLTQPQPLSLKDVQGLLDTSTVVLEYSLGEKRSYVWVVGVDSLEMRELPGRAEIEPVARQFYRALTTRTHKVNADPKREVAHWAEVDGLAQALGMRLSRMVLTPVSSLIRGKRLLIVSDGALEYIPFSALPTPEEPKVPLLVKHEIVALPSASVLGEIRRASANRPRLAREVAVLADPVFDAQDERVLGAVNGPAVRTAANPPSEHVKSSRSMHRGGFYLKRLMYSRDEAEAIRTLAPRGKIFVGLDFDANRAMAISPELARYRIVHFATHGFFDSSHPELSGLVLSLVDRQGKPQEGFLALEDIYNLKLPADLVVLSSCQTALGENIGGEGLMGLTRGFMYAGASRVVASLWSVDDYTTSELMADFYRAMEVDKMRPAAALRKAQLEIWRHTGWQAPYYWAGFQLQGEWK